MRGEERRVETEGEVEKEKKMTGGETKKRQKLSKNTGDSEHERSR